MYDIVPTYVDRALRSDRIRQNLQSITHVRTRARDRSRSFAITKILFLRRSTHTEMLPQPARHIKDSPSILLKSISACRHRWFVAKKYEMSIVFSASCLFEAWQMECRGIISCRIDRSNSPSVNATWTIVTGLCFQLPVYIN